MKYAFWIFIALYAAAVFLVLASLNGWFGQEEDPLSAIFLLPLGLPWNVLADRLIGTSTAFTIGAPLINAAILFWLWKR